MKRLVILLALFAVYSGRAQNNQFTNEDFVNEIAPLVVDSSFSHYFLFSTAAPCSFKNFDYDEWYKYSLKEDVPFYILNDLAKKSFEDIGPRSWQQQNLSKAICIDQEEARRLLERAVKRPAKHPGRNDNENKLVFYFSRPVFTNDYAYAVIDMGFRCDDRQCGMGATFLFRKTNGKWLLAGRKVAWGN